MDESLFVKHLVQIKKQKEGKTAILEKIKEKTGIELDEKMISVSKKEVSFHLSSSLRQRLHQKKVFSFLEEEGFVIKG